MAAVHQDTAAFHDSNDAAMHEEEEAENIRHSSVLAKALEKGVVSVCARATCLHLPHRY